MAPKSSDATEGLVYFAIETLLILWRICMRWRSLTFRGLAMDDYLMMLVLVWNVAGTVISCVVLFVTQGLANSGMTDEERASLSPNSAEFRLRVEGSKTHLAGWISFATLLWTLKLCWLFFYKRLGHRVNKMALKVNMGLIFCGVTYTALLCVILFGCVPFEKSWQINPDPGDFCHPSSSTLQSWVMLFSDVATDLFITIIPLPGGGQMIWHARINKVNKIGLIIMFCGGLLTMTFSIARCAIILRDSASATELAAVWSDREAFVAIIVTNVPVLVPLIRQRFWNIKDKSVPSASRSVGDSRVRGDWNRAHGRGDVVREMPGTSLGVGASASSLPNKMPSASSESFYDSESDGANSPTGDGDMRLGVMNETHIVI
ncbi:hypothetical protein XA68_16162 [Ophiocordyceps unilateralis]|uniref:Rhodopsin domain-containing protein n=1 Tax=Ophiocordyceps unilateralis TaxID=268505 RepID=A0A2A9PKD8_OPHUN|nr:hypothetical protein XA68_16162 [Ophiocordyceps unilateralis]